MIYVFFHYFGIFLILILLSVGILPQNSEDYLPHKRPSLPKPSNSSNPIQLEKEESVDEDKVVQTLVTNTKKKRIKKREKENNEKTTFSELDSDRKEYLIKQAIATLRKYEIRRDAEKLLSNALLTHPIPDVREEAARALGRLKVGAPALKKAIFQDSFSVRRQAFIALEKVGGADTLKYFIAGIKSTDPDIRIASFKGLGKTQNPFARELLINKGLNSQETTIVAAALAGLGNFSRPEDLPLFKKYLPSEVVELQIGAIQGLGNSKANGTLELLTKAIDENQNLLPEIIFSISQKKSLHSTLLLFKILLNTNNENYKLMIQKEFIKRGAYGMYAVVTNPTASMKKDPRTNSDRVAVLLQGDVSLVKNITDKLFKVKMNNEVYEHRYYQVQAINNKDQFNLPIVQGWIFGPKLKFITIRKPDKGSYKNGKLEDVLNLNEETEDENYLPPNTSIEKKNDKPKTDSGSDNKKSDKDKKNDAFDDDDE